MQIHIGVWDHEHGTDVSAHRSTEGLEKWRQEIVQDNWEEHFQDEEMPADPSEAADRYFELMGDRIDRWQWFEERTVEIGD